MRFIEMSRQLGDLRFMDMHGHALGHLPLYELQQSVARRSSQMLELELFEVGAHLILTHVLSVTET